jgi:hypothetical protein
MVGRKKKERLVFTKAEHDEKVKVFQTQHALKKREEELTLYSDGQPYDKVRVIGELKFYLTETVTSIFDAGKRLIWLKEKEAHGEWQKIIDDLEISRPTAWRMMAIARRLTNCFTVKQLSVHKWKYGIGKLYAMLDVPDEDLKLFEESGSFLGKPMDEIERMSVREVRDLARKHRETQAGWQKKVEKKDEVIEQWKKVAAEKDQQMINLKLGFSGEEQTALAQMQNAKTDFIHLYNRLNDADLSEASDKILAEYINLLYFIEDVARLLAVSKDREFNRTGDPLDGVLNIQEKLVWEKHPEFFDGKEPEVVKINRLQKEKFDKEQAELAALTKKYGSSNLKSERDGGGEKAN